MTWHTYKEGVDNGSMVSVHSFNLLNLSVDTTICLLNSAAIMYPDLLLSRLDRYNRAPHSVKRGLSAFISLCFVLALVGIAYLIMRCFYLIF